MGLDSDGRKRKRSSEVLDDARKEENDEDLIDS